jgi:stage II sporulation protein R
MVKYKALILVIIICLVAITPASANNDAMKYAYIRLHVIANSDSPEDQAVKLRVRDAILKEHSMALMYVGNKNDSKAIVTMHLSEIEATAQKTLSTYGFQYNVEAIYSQEQFPEKTYGDIVYPPGEYTALRVVLGSGEGQNWWCVMFPPLCIGSEAVAQAKETEEVVYDFKLREWFEKIKHAISRV